MKEQQLEMWSQPTQDISVSQLDNAVKALREAKDKYSEAKAISDSMYAVVKETETALISILKAAGKEKYIAEGVGTVSLSERLSVPTPKTPEQKEAFFNWLREEMGQDGYLTYATVNSNSLNSLYRQKVEEYGERGEVLEIGGIEAPTSYTSLSLRKA